MDPLIRRLLLAACFVGIIFGLFWDTILGPPEIGSDGSGGKAGASSACPFIRGDQDATNQPLPPGHPGSGESNRAVDTPLPRKGGAPDAQSLIDGLESVDQPLPAADERRFTETELEAFDGRTRAEIYIGVGGEVFDVTSGGYYGPGASYSVLAGRAATRAIALPSLDEDDIHDDCSDFNAEQMFQRDGWVRYFKAKYKRVGVLVPDTPSERKARLARRAEAKAAATATKRVELDKKRKGAGERLYTTEELAAFDGSDPSKPLLLAVGGHVFDVTPSSWLYGPGSPRGVYAGRAVTRAVTLQSVTPDDLERGDDVSDFDVKQMQTMDERIEFYLGKFAKVGTIALRPDL